MATRNEVRVVPATEVRNNLSEVLDDAEQNGITLVRRHKQTSLALVNADLLEDLLELHDHDYREAINKARQDVKEGRVYTLDEAFGDLL